MTHKIITVHFTVSENPAIGLIPTIDIYELNLVDPSINPLVIDNGVLTEIGVGWYRYDFQTYDQTKNYVYTIDGGSSLVGGERWKIGGNESYVEDISSEVWNETSTDHHITGSTGGVLQQINLETTAIFYRLTEAWGRLGLDPSKPLITGQTEVSFGDIVMALTEVSGHVTLTRQ